MTQDAAGSPAGWRPFPTAQGLCTRLLFSGPGRLDTLAGNSPSPLQCISQAMCQSVHTIYVKTFTCWANPAIHFGVRSLAPWKQKASNQCQSIQTQQFEQPLCICRKKSQFQVSHLSKCTQIPPDCHSTGKVTGPVSICLYENKIHKQEAMLS